MQSPVVKTIGDMDADTLTVRDPSAIAQELAAKIAKDRPFTRIENRCMISVRPMRGLPLYSDTQSKVYAEKSNASSSNDGAHVFDISASAYYHAIRGKANQSIILLGETGSGKSEIYRVLLRNFCDLSKQSEKKARIHSYLLRQQTILNAFGRAATPANFNATCFSQYTELQFDAKGRMLGVKLIEYMLEKSRVTGPSDGGTSFQIFYKLLQGASVDERIELHLSDSAHFYYLANSSVVPQFDGQETFDLVKSNLKSLGVGRRQQKQLWRILAAILHIGNIQFLDSVSGRETCSVKNTAQLQLVAEILGVDTLALQTVLISKTKIVGKDNVSLFLDAAQAKLQRDCFARTLYAVLFSWIIEQINLKTCASEVSFSNVVTLFEVPGFAGNLNPKNGFCRLMANYVNERLFAHVRKELFENPKLDFENQSIAFPAVPSSPNKDIIGLLTDPSNGIISLTDKEAAKARSNTDLTAKIYDFHLNSGILISASSKRISHAFGIHHFAGPVEYDTEDFVSSDADVLQSDFVTLIRGNPENPGTTNDFLRSVFSDKLIATKKASDLKTVTSATLSRRAPSIKRKRTLGGDDAEDRGLGATNGFIIREDLNSVLETLCSTETWFIFCLKSFNGTTSKISKDVLKRQIAAFDLGSIVNNPAARYTANYSFDEFVKRYNVIPGFPAQNGKSGCAAFAADRNWSEKDFVIGTTSIFLAERTWLALERNLKQIEQADLPPGSKALSSGQSSSNNETPRATGYAGSINGGSDMTGDTESHYDSEFEFPTAIHTDVETGHLPRAAAVDSKPKKVIPPPEIPPTTPLRRRWLCCVWCSSWCFAPICLRSCGRMGTKERQLAWREKFALCVIILFMNLFVLFLIIGTGYIICPIDPQRPKQSPGEISGRNLNSGKPAVQMYGNYYAVSPILKKHISNYMDQTSQNPSYFEVNVNGREVTYMFPRHNFPTALDSRRRPYCSLPVPSGFQMRSPEENDNRWVPHPLNAIQDVEQYLLGPMVVDKETLNKRIGDGSSGTKFLIIYDRVYDLTPFYSPTLNPSLVGSQFWLGRYFTDAANYYTRGNQIQDATSEFIKFRSQDARQHDNVMQCLNSFFFIGQVDHRNDLECIVSNYILLGFSVVLVSVIGFKFLAALQFPGKKSPEELEKFVICQVPCYTEGEESIHRTIDSLANLRYDDKHKVLFVICDGMIIGSGNDRPTPRIVLDVLGVDPDYDPESFAYQSLGSNNQQLNYGKVYSGLYELNGHVVPFIVVVKVGKPSERGKPGNRGKRDSQLILMRFLMRVHGNLPMSPLELEIYHHFKHIIGVDPAAYEFAFMVDADTQVHEDSLNHLVSQMTRDSKIAATCGETSIANDKKSFTSMIQVYEYFISHNMAKAFESLFGSVTCLPGCFCIYRIRTPYKNTPILINAGLVADYSENNVETLHLKNLLHLGEDRYLTTLTMKHFPGMKTAFCPEAHCKTFAPDQWSVLLSQRRRWINSTVHNLFELLRLNELCGFCCVSMRFVVFVDLIATFIQPASLIYIAYIIFLASTGNLGNVPVISLIMIACVYGFQVVIFLLKTEWQHIGWMIFYVLAIPLFGFYIPIYAFWHFDDFSWGNTRKAIESTEKSNTDEEYFDPDSVPLVKWSQFQNTKTQSSSNSDTNAKSIGYGSIHGVDYADSVSTYSVPTHDSSAPSARFPTDEELLNEIRHILSTADLMQVTKKSVRDKLTRLFGVDVTPRKEYIHYCIDSILKGEL